MVDPFAGPDVHLSSQRCRRRLRGSPGRPPPLGRRCSCSPTCCHHAWGASQHPKSWDPSPGRWRSEDICTWYKSINGGIHQEQLCPSFVGIKNEVPALPHTKWHSLPKNHPYKMTLQVPHTYPARAYKMPLELFIFAWKSYVPMVKKSGKHFVVSGNSVSDQSLCKDVFFPEPFCRQEKHQCSQEGSILAYLLSSRSCLEQCWQNFMVFTFFLCENNLGKGGNKVPLTKQSSNQVLLTKQSGSQVLLTKPWRGYAPLVDITKWGAHPPVYKMGAG